MPTKKKDIEKQLNQGLAFIHEFKKTHNQWNVEGLDEIIFAASRSLSVEEELLGRDVRDGAICVPSKIDLLPLLAAKQEGKKKTIN